MTSFALRLGQAMALGRVAIGVSALAAPTLLARPWIGDGAARQDARLLARTMGGRDVALGLGALRALSRDRTDEARIWVGLGGMADAVDATVTVLAQFNDGTSQLITVPVIIYHPLLAATTNAGTYNTTFGTPFNSANVNGTRESSSAMFVSNSMLSLFCSISLACSFARWSAGRSIPARR